MLFNQIKQRVKTIDYFREIKVKRRTLAEGEKKKEEKEGNKKEKEEENEGNKKEKEENE